MRHAEEGASIIDRLGFLTDAVPAIRHHHERYDGRGYPDRLAGRGHPARRPDHPRRRRVRLDALDARLPARALARGRARASSQRMAGQPVLPALRRGAERVIARDEDRAPRSTSSAVAVAS